MAGPSQVEFPGKKKQRMQMKGTKQANEATSKKIARDLRKFLQNPREHLPAMTFEGKLRWGRKDPVTKTLNEIEKIIRNKDDKNWLSKRMMAKRGDDVAKAFAGSLHAAHDTEFTTVGQFDSPSFGGGSYVRRGDGKPGYLAGLQNFHNLTLRMLPWEYHAKLGMYFFSWEGGFVCTGPRPEPPLGWLDDVLRRSRFSFQKTTVDGVDVWTTTGIDSKIVINNESSEIGYLKLQFHHGPIVAIDLENIQTFSKKDSPFVHHLALSMLPPLLPSILKLQAVWVPQGWPSQRELPPRCQEGIQRILDAYQGLTLNEGVLSQQMKGVILEGIDDGVLIGSRWMDGHSTEQILAALSDLAGSAEEHELTANILHLASTDEGDSISIRIEPKGSVTTRDQGCLRIMDGASCGDILAALWTDFGLQALLAHGLAEDEAQRIWNTQHESPQPFGKFLKNLDKTRALTQRIARFPECEVKQGATKLIHQFIVEGHTKGLGHVERLATSRHADIDSAAAAWAWLTAVGRASGQEWHFDKNAQDRGGVWALPTKSLWEIGQRLMAASDEEILPLQQEWHVAMKQLSIHLGGYSDKK